MPNIQTKSRAWSVRWLLTAAGVGLLLVTVSILLRQHLSMRIGFDDEVLVDLHGATPFRVRIAQPMAVDIDKEIEARVRLGTLPIALDETLDVPLNMTLAVPLDATVHVDQPLDLALRIPIDTVLTERELDLSQLSVPIDTDLFIDDTIVIDMVVPLDTHVTTAFGVSVPVKAQLPIKAKLPIRQKIHVRDTLKLNVRRLRVPLKLDLPVQVHVPLDNDIHIRGTILAPVHERLRVPLHKVIQAQLTTDAPVTVKLSGRLPVRIDATLDATVTSQEKLHIGMKQLRIDAKNVHVDFK